MPFRILLVSATLLEIKELKKIPGLKKTSRGFSYGKTDIEVLVTGVGSIAASWSVYDWLRSNPKPDLVLNLGIAGSYRDDIKPGNVVTPLSDCFADAGIEDGNSFLTLGEAGLAGPEDFPYTSGVIESDKKYAHLVIDTLKVKAVTVNTSTGSEATRERLIKKYNPDIETMEGATFFYIFAREFIPFLALRAISNMVETRNLKNWNIPLAIESLAEKFYEVILRV